VLDNASLMQTAMLPAVGLVRLLFPQFRTSRMYSKLFKLSVNGEVVKVREISGNVYIL